MVRKTKAFNMEHPDARSHIESQAGQGLWRLDSKPRPLSVA